MNDATGISSHFKKKRRKSPSNPSSPEQQHQRNPNSEPQLKSPDFSVVGQLEHRSRSTPFINFGIDHSFDCSEASDDSHEEEASWPVLCHSPEDDDQRKRFCDLFALALRGTPSDRQLFASVRSGRRGDTDCSRAVNSRGDLEGATSDINNHQLLLEEELLGLCDYSDEEEKAAPVVRENDDHDTEETQKGGDDNYLHQISVGNSDNIAAPGQNVKASVKEEDDSIYFYRNNPTLVKHELVVLVRSQPWATSLTNQNLLLSSTPASADDSVKNFTRRNKRQDKESVKRAAGGGEEGLSTRRARRTETQASSNSNINSQKLPKRRLHTPYGRSLHQLSVSNIVDSEQAALNDKRPHSGSAIVKVGDETTSSEPPDADAGSASVMEHLRQLVYRRYAGSQAEAVKLSQASYTSADDQQDSLSGSLLSSVPDLSRRYRPALEASQQATSRRTMPALKTDSHQSQNGHTLPTAELAAAVEGSGVKATDDFVWRERPLENDGKKDQFQANDRKPVDIEGSSLPLGDGAEIPNSSVVRQAPPAVLSAGKSLLNAEICSVDMARESETTSAQDVVDAKLNGSQHHEKIPTISASFSNTGNVTNVDVTVKPEALVPSESPKTPKLTVQVPTADLNNNNNNNSNTTINKKVPDSKKAYSKQQQIAQQKVKLQQQRPAKPKSSEVSTKRSSSATPHGATSQKTAVSEKRAPSKSGSSESKKCQKSKTVPSTTGGTGIKGGHGSSGNQQYSVSSFNAASPVCQLNNDVWNSPTHQFNGNSNANNSTSPICSKNHNNNNNNYLGQESQPVQVAQHQSSSQYWQYEALPGVMQQHIDQFASYSSPQQIVTSALPGGYSNSNSNSMDFASGTSEMGRGVLEQWSGGRSSPVFIRENNVRIAPLYRQHHLHTMDSHTTPTMYSNCSNSSESMDYSQQTTSAHNNAMQQQQQQQQQPQQQQQQQQQFYQHPSQQQVHHTTNITNGGTHVGYNNGNNYAYGNNSQTNRSVLISQPQPNVISIEEALAQLADEDAAMWHEPSTSDHNIQHPTSAQCSAQNVQISSPNFSDNSERYNLNISSNQITSPAPLSPPAKRNSPLNSSSDEMSSWSTDVKKRALMAACRPADQPPDFPGGEQLRALAQPDGTTAPTTCYGLEVSFPQQVFVVLRNKLNSSAEVLDVNVEPSAARALRALRLPPTMERPSLELVQQRFAAFSNATGLPPLYDYSRPELVTQPKEPRPRRVLALCCAYRLRFPALFFGSTTGIENEQDLHDFVHCAAFSGVFNSWNLDQLNAIRKFKELVPPPPPQYQQCVSQTEAFLVLVAHLRVANVPSGRPPPTLRHVVLAPWAAQEINDSLTALSPAVQASSDALVVFNESRKLNTRTQNVTYCTFFAGVRLLDAAENGTYLTPQQLFDVPVQLSDDGAKVLRKLFSFMYEVYETCGSMDRYAALREARNRLNLDDATFFAVLHARRPVSLIRPRGSYDLSPEHVRRVVLGDGDKSSSRKEAKTPRKSSASSKSESSNTRAIAEESCESILPPGTPGTPTTPGTP